MKNSNQRSAARHAAARFAERRVFTLLLQFLQELWRQADVHGQRHALADILQQIHTQLDTQLVNRVALVHVTTADTSVKVSLSSSSLLLPL